MSQEAINAVQKLFNEAVTLENDWDTCRIATVAGYTTAYQRQRTALQNSKKLSALDNKSLYLLFVNIAASVIGPWVGRLLEQGEAAAEKVAGEIFQKTLDSVTDKTADLMKDSIAESLAKKADVGRAWEPVLVSPEEYGKLIGISYNTMKSKVLGSIMQFIELADRWPASVAQSFVADFRIHCPYFADLRKDPGLETSVAVQSEKAMWIEWGLQRDLKWWQENNTSMAGLNALVAMDPIVETLTNHVHVPEFEITSIVRWGNVFGAQRRQALDMLKLIDWAKRNQPLNAHELKALKEMHFFHHSRLQACRNDESSLLAIP